MRPAALSFFLLVSAGLPAQPLTDSLSEPAPLDSTVNQAVEPGDTSGLRIWLDKTIESQPESWQAYLLRGQLRLEAGDRNGARADFTKALYSKDNYILARAHSGLGKVLRSLPRKNWEAIKEYRRAIKLDPDLLEAYHSAAQAALAMETPKGYGVASQMLLELICRDPIYKGAYKTWCDTILVKRKSELRKAILCLESYIISHPEKNGWLLDIAQFYYKLDKVDAALETLDRLERKDPSYRPTERYLLRARCLVVREDAAGFESAYQEALASAKEVEDFLPLVIDAETIFRPEELIKAGQIKTAEEWRDFFRVFWARRDPDPLDPYNERRVEHYKRLREAKRRYSIMLPYSKLVNSRDLYRLSSFAAIDDISSPYNYDPDLFRLRLRELALEPRGLLYVRHGPPKMISRPIMEDLRMPRLNEEVWFYGGVFFPFGELTIGDARSTVGMNYYVFRPVPVRGLGDMKKAMETESFKDPLPVFQQDFYGTNFLGQDGKIELEVYQSAPVDKVKSPDAPGVILAVLDSTWRELARDSTRAVKALSGGDSVWIGVNRIKSGPGERVMVARLDIPGKRAEQRKSIQLFPYRGNGLELSGLVLGGSPAESRPVHRREGISLLPRPSLKFKAGEPIYVYCEIYGLQPDPHDSRLSFSERVTVTLLAEQKSELKELFGKFAWWNDERGTSLTLNFDRNPPPPRGHVLPETFTLNTYNLVPGSYLLSVEVHDKQTGRRSRSGCQFEISGD
ncbi:MAG: GWxTD domain-containing protein [Candidatus Glassbacteria bacterium]